MMMARKKKQEDPIELGRFTARILFCLKQERMLNSEVRIAYLQRYPPGFVFRNKPLLTLKQEKVDIAINELMGHNFIKSELTRWHNGESLRQDSSVYIITDLGIEFLNTPKK